MTTLQKTKKKTKPLSRLVTTIQKPNASTNVEHDDIISLKQYFPGPSTLDVIKRFANSLTNSKNGVMLSITGPYGSGKSTMATFLKGLTSSRSTTEWQTSHHILKKIAPDIDKLLVDGRRLTETDERGLLTCAISARREPLSITILRALHKGAEQYFGRYTNKHFANADLLVHAINNLDKTPPKTSDIIEIISSMCQVSPVLLLIDEFGKNIEYFTVDGTENSDLFLLQQLAEMSGRGRRVPLSIITLQHMAFEEYVGVSMNQKREWSKIQGRFEDIPFANSPDQIRLLISKSIRIDNSIASNKIIKRWAEQQLKKLQHIVNNESSTDLIAACYPLDPLSLEILPELCTRYGQHERTLLSFITSGGKHTVATFIDQNTWDNTARLPTMSIDVLYDYFIRDTSMIHSNSNITRLMEIETIIRDAHGLTDLETKTLKVIGLINLISTSGNLRASQRVIEYAIGCNPNLILKKLEKRSIITFRKHADEYRIWRGTDIDIAVNLEIQSKRYQNTPLLEILNQTIRIDAIVAAKHNIETGSMRLFERRFADGSNTVHVDDAYDGAIIYRIANCAIPKANKPIIVIDAQDFTDLRVASIQVMAIQDTLNDETVVNDWVATKELRERLADAETRMDQVFNSTYGYDARWSYLGKNKAIGNDTLSSIVSKVCDVAYNQTPKIYNEMINRNVISSQGITARKNLFDRMLTSPHKHSFGIEGWGPERALYEAMFAKKIHVGKFNSEWKLQDVNDESLTPSWNMMLDTIRSSKTRVSIFDIYEKCKLPPYGIKEGVIPLFVIPILLIHKDNIAVYEHGSYVPKITIEVIERMVKNPVHFEVKYFKLTPSKKQLIQTVSNDLGIKTNSSILGIVSHIVRIVSTLPPYVIKTQRLNKNTLAVKGSIISAIEPDVLLFHTLPKALGFKPFSTSVSDKDIIKFSKTLANSVKTLQNEFDKTLDDVIDMLYETTGIYDRAKLSKLAKMMLDDVTNKTMKTFLSAISTDALESDYDWIKYVALSLTDIPPANWKDEQRLMFENKLAEISSQFNRLASLHFANIVDAFETPYCQITITHADGNEEHKMVALNPERKKVIEKEAKNILRSLKKKGFSVKDRDALVAILSSED